MLILAVDSAGEGLTMALGDGGRTWQVGRTAHDSDESLWPALDSLVKKAKRRLQDIKAVAAAVGPGRFTAVRVGVTFADTVARALGVPAVGLTRFDAMAEGLAGEDGAVGLVIETFRGEAYLQRWTKEGDSMTPAAKPTWVAAGGLAAALAGARQVDARGVAAAGLLGPARRRLRGGRPPPLRPLYLKPANYKKPS